MLVKDYFVHSLGKVKVDLAEEGGGVRGALASEGLGVLGHAEDSVDLLIVNLWYLMGRHIFNIVVIFYQGVSMYSISISLFESASEYSRILFVK